MPGGNQGPYNQLPKDVNVLRVGVPFAGWPTLTAINAINSCVGEVTITNTGVSTIQFSLADTQASPQYIFYKVNIDPGVPFSAQFDPPEYCHGGIQWGASATGLEASLRGRSVMGLTLGANNAPA